VPPDADADDGPDPDDPVADEPGGGGGAGEPAGPAPVQTTGDEVGEPTVHGRPGGDGSVSACVVSPPGVVTWAALTPALPGHHATNQPLPMVASTSSPALRTNVRPVTSALIRPSTSV